VKAIYIFIGSQRLVEVSDMEMLKQLHDRLVLSIGKKLIVKIYIFLFSS
jgi:hypothetical protein